MMPNTNNVTATITSGRGGNQTGIACMPVTYGVMRRDATYANGNPINTPKPAAGSTRQSLPQIRMKTATPINQINIE